MLQQKLELKLQTINQIHHSNRENLHLLVEEVQPLHIMKIIDLDSLLAMDKVGCREAKPALRHN
jgi:hypothetical protein